MTSVDLVATTIVSDAVSDAETGAVAETAGVAETGAVAEMEVVFPDSANRALAPDSEGPSDSAKRVDPDSEGPS